jgi:hypothetical protein
MSPEDAFTSRYLIKSAMSEPPRRSRADSCCSWSWSRSGSSMRSTNAEFITAGLMAGTNKRLGREVGSGQRGSRLCRRSPDGSFVKGFASGWRCNRDASGKIGFMSCERAGTGAGENRPVRRRDPGGTKACRIGRSNTELLPGWEPGQGAGQKKCSHWTEIRRRRTGQTNLFTGSRAGTTGRSGGAPAGLRAGDTGPARRSVPAGSVSGHRAGQTKRSGRDGDRENWPVDRSVPAGNIGISGSVQLFRPGRIQCRVRKEDRPGRVSGRRRNPKMRPSRNEETGSIAGS